MDAELHIVDEEVQVVDEFELVLLVVPYKFYQENIALLKHTQVTVLIISRLKSSLPDDNNWNIMSLLVPQQSLNMIIVDFIIITYFRILVVPFCLQFRDIEELVFVIVVSFVIVFLLFLVIDVDDSVWFMNT